MPSMPDLRLSRIDTSWSVVCQAHREGTEAAAAQRQLLERYGGAVRRYLLAATRDGRPAVLEFITREEAVYPVATQLLRDVAAEVLVSA